MNLIDIRKKQLLELCKTCLGVYSSYLDSDELKLINNISNNIDNLVEIEEKLLQIVSKIWERELATGEYIVISWNKFATEKRKKGITFATLNKKGKIVPFCGLTSGKEYKISFPAIVGALNKDGATLFEDFSKKNDYTIGTIGDKVINSYNGATRLITPYQLISDNLENDYKSLHNELILKTDLIEEIGPFVLDDNSFKAK